MFLAAEDARHSASRMGRRKLLLGILARATAAAAAPACSGAAAVPSSPAPPVALRPQGTRGIAVWSHFDLPPADTRSHELSGAAWDPTERLLWAVQDDTPRIVGLVPDRELATWTFGPSIDIDCRGPLDLEGLVVLPEAFIVASEIGPRIVELDRKGRFVRDLPFPTRFTDARQNASFESLTISPSGRYLFTTTEGALGCDGALATHDAGTRVRLLRLDRKTGEIGEHLYITDPAPYESGDWGISELTALDDERLLVLERGWSRGHGNGARIYETVLHERAACGHLEQLSSGSASLGKSLRLDLGRLEAAGFPAARQPQPTALLDNFEAMTLGPPLPDGRPSLVLVSDDNGRSDQVARILVLAL